MVDCFQEVLDRISSHWLLHNTLLLTCLYEIADNYRLLQIHYQATKKIAVAFCISIGQYQLSVEVGESATSACIQHTLLFPLRGFTISVSLSTV